MDKICIPPCVSVYQSITIFHKVSLTQVGTFVNTSGLLTLLSLANGTVYPLFLLPMYGIIRLGKFLRLSVTCRPTNLFVFNP